MLTVVLVPVLVRPATAADVPAAEQVRITSWKSAYRGLVDDAVLDGLRVTEERVTRLTERLGTSADLLVAVHDDQVVGMAVHGQCRDPDLPELRELYALYVDPAGWRQGTGTALLDACGDVRVLWVLEGNLRARTFYERHGFRADGTRKLIDLGVDVPEVRYRRTGEGSGVAAGCAPR